MKKNIFLIKNKLYGLPETIIVYNDKLKINNHKNNK